MVETRIRAVFSLQANNFFELPREREREKVGKVCARFGRWRKEGPTDPPFPKIQIQIQSLLKWEGKGGEVGWVVEERGREKYSCGNQVPGLFFLNMLCGGTLPVQYVPYKGKKTFFQTIEFAMLHIPNFYEIFGICWKTF